jgi:hypothetical protein
MRSRCCLCVCLCIPPIVARQRLVKNPPIVARKRLGRNVTAVTNTHATIEELLDASFPRTSCLLFLLVLSPIHPQVFQVISSLMVSRPKFYTSLSSSDSCYMPQPAHPPWFRLPNNILRGVQVMKLLSEQLSPFCCYFLPLRSKYSSQHPVLISSTAFCPILERQTRPHDADRGWRYSSGHRVHAASCTVRELRNVAPDVTPVPPNNAVFCSNCRRKITRIRSDLTAPNFCLAI